MNRLGHWNSFKIKKMENGYFNATLVPPWRPIKIYMMNSPGIEDTLSINFKSSETTSSKGHHSSKEWKKTAPHINASSISTHFQFQIAIIPFFLAAFAFFHFLIATYWRVLALHWQMNFDVLNRVHLHGGNKNKKAQGSIEMQTRINIHLNSLK